jgi:hypothetical protein
MWYDEGTPSVVKDLLVKNARQNKGDLFQMAENICLMLIEADTLHMLARVLSLATAAVDQHKRTVLYVGERWAELAWTGVLEKRDREFKASSKGLSLGELFHHFQNTGGQLWVSAFDAPGKQPLAEGVTVVDDKTLLTFLTQDTVVLNF